MLISLTIFGLAVILIMLRPKPLNEATAAALGGAAMLIASIVSPVDAWQVLQANANVLLFFLGLMVISVVADCAGFFSWCAYQAVKLAHGRGTAILGVVFGLGVVLTAFFSNDATALILTPIVFALVTRLKLDALPYVFACAFTANTASMLLPVSNPVNLLAVDRFAVTLGEYLKYLLLPGLLVTAANWLLFRIIFRRRLARTVPDHGGLEPVRVDSFFWAVSAGLTATALGYILVSIYGLPLSYPAAGGALLLLTLAVIFRRITLKRITGGISWHIFVFIFALAVLVRGLENSGVIQILANGLSRLAARGPLQALVSITLGTAAGSNLINNWSMMMVSVSSLGSLAPGFDRTLVCGSIMGADLGPNIAVLGSLSSMLWLVLLRQRGLDIRPVQYLKLGLIVTPVLLVIGVFSLYLTGHIWG